MILMKYRGVKGLVIGNLVFLFVLVNLLVSANVLTFKMEYLFGVLAGFIMVWVIYNIYAVREIRKPGYKMDERMKLILQKSGFAAFFIFYIIAAFFAIISRAIDVRIPVTVPGLAALAVNLMFAIFIICVLILRKRY